MPEKTETIIAAGYNATALQSLAYGALLELNWTIKYAGEYLLIGYTPRSWKKYDNEITLTTLEGQLTVTSKMVHNESFDMMGRTKKDVAAFSTAFEKVKNSASQEQLAGWQEKIEALQAETIQIAEQELRQAEEVDKVMNFSRGNMMAAYVIMGINLLVFVAMAISGVNVFAPLTLDILKWGGNNPVLTFGGEWWRLLSCMFVHVGILHLLLNMYALYFVSVYLEPMLGKTRYVIAYLCTGLLSSIVSAYWHKDTGITSAGASGAIFGMYGVFLALLTTNIIPKHVKKALLQSILIFVAFNIFYGLKSGSGIDNSAHLGGLISGMLIGYIYYFTFKTVSAKRILAVSLVIAAATCVTIFFFLEKEALPRTSLQEQLSTDERQKVFDAKIEQFAELETTALEPENDTLSSPADRIKAYQSITVPAWNEATVVLEEMQTAAVTSTEKKRVGVLMEYVQLRKKLTKLQIQNLQENNGQTIQEINLVVEQINKLFQ